MRLSYLALKNYRRFRDVEIELPDGLVGIIGQNGAGKSSLMEAVAWARKACAADPRPRPSLLDTLAAALAEDGQFAEAIKVSRQFQELVAEEPVLVESAEARIRLFQAAQPFHEP